MTETKRHKYYTESQGDDLYDITVSRIESLDAYTYGEKLLLCDLRGAEYDFRTGDRQVPKLKIRTRIYGVTDFEHDTSSFAMIDVALPTLMYEYGGRREYVGIIDDVRLYPLGVDPFDPSQDDGDTSSHICDLGTAYPNDYPNHEPHQMAPYLPPQRPELERLNGKPVVVSINLAADVRKLWRETQKQAPRHPVPDLSKKDDEDDE